MKKAGCTSGSAGMCQQSLVHQSGRSTPQVHFEEIIQRSPETLPLHRFHRDAASG